MQCHTTWSPAKNKSKPSCRTWHASCFEERGHPKYCIVQVTQESTTILTYIRNSMNTRVKIHLSMGVVASYGTEIQISHALDWCSVKNGGTHTQTHLIVVNFPYLRYFEMMKLSNNYLFHLGLLVWVSLVVACSAQEDDVLGGESNDYSSPSDSFSKHRWR